MLGPKPKQEKDVTVADAIARSVPQVGYPGDCPTCGRGGYLVTIDLTNDRSRSECRSCKTEWGTVKDAAGARAVPI